MALGKPPEAESLGRADPGGGDRAPCLAVLVPLAGAFFGRVAGEVEPPVRGLLFLAARPGNETLGPLEGGLLPRLGPLESARSLR